MRDVLREITSFRATAPRRAYKVSHQCPSSSMTSWRTLLSPPGPLNSPPPRAAARQKLTIFDHVGTSGCCSRPERPRVRPRVPLDVPDRHTKRGAAHYRVYTATLARRRRPKSNQTAAAARETRRQSPEPVGMSTSNTIADSRFQEVSLDRSFQRVRRRLREPVLSA